MPRTSIAEHSDVDKNVFDKETTDRLKIAIAMGCTVEKVESSLSDPGDDYYEFRIDGKTVCHINWY
jgi:hypothetical protein